MAHLLSHNILRDIFDNEGQLPAGAPQPVLQALAVKKLTSAAPASPDRWRVVVSDGVHYANSMLATQLNSLVTDEEIQKGGFLRLETFTLNKMKEKRFVSRERVLM
jgi:replication factor A1